MNLSRSARMTRDGVKAAEAALGPARLGDWLFPLRQRLHEKRNIYNLNEDEELTHYGQSLADIEKLNDIVDSDSDPEERGTLSGKGSRP